MGLEIERRFLVTDDGWTSHAGPPQPLRQGYLASSAEGITVRMRLRGEDQAWLTLKASADPSGIARHEFEYGIPVSDAEDLWRLAPHRLKKSVMPSIFQVGSGWSTVLQKPMRPWCWPKWS